MKITCALSQSQSEKLYKTVYKSLTEALKTEKKFSAQEYMANLFDKIADKKDEDTAVKFLQQVPSIIRTIAAKPAFDTLDIKLDPIKELSLKFKDEAEGFNEVQKYFKPQVSQRAKLALIRAKQNNALLAEQVDPPTEVKDPVRLRPFSSNVSTMQLLIPINPNDKDKLLKEENDPAKKRIFSAIETIKKEAVLSDSTDVLSPISFQGKTLKLKPILLTELRETHENQIDKTTLSEVIRAGAIKSQGTNKEGVEGLNRIALVITDESGNYLYFNEEGEMVTEEEGGGIVYQFMRDVRTDNGVYRLTNMYGSETSVKTPADIAEQMGITEEAARKLQQEEFKDLYKVKEATLKGNGPLLYLTGLTPGVKQSATQKNITLENLRSLPFVTNATFKTITPKMIYGTKEIATITLNGQEYNLDRPNLPIEFANGKRQPSQLIRKIAAALANPNISNQEKYEYVSQFLSDKASEYTRRHTLSYDEATDTLVFGYNEKTYKQGSGNKLSFINEELTGKESIIEDVLLNAASDDRGNMYSAKMTYNAKALNDNRYRDYDMEANTVSDEFTPYIPFLETLPNSKVKISEEDAPEFYNSHMNFSIPDEFTKEIEADFKNPDPINVSVTPVELTEDIEAKKADIERNLGIKLSDYLAYTMGSTGAMTWDKLLSGIDNDGNPIPENEKHVILSSYDLGDNYFAIGYKANNSPNTINFQIYKKGNNIAEGKAFVSSSKEFNKLSAKDNTVENKIKELNAKYNAELAALEGAPVEQKWEWPPITQDDSINNATAPDNTTDPTDDFSDFMFRKGADLNGVTEEQIKAAEEWWNSSPLSKYLDFKTMVNIVNSDVYARFIGYASVLNGKYGNIEISRTGTMVDVYHEAWHAFSQIFLTKEQREKLYKEIAKQPGTFTLLDGTTVAFKDANYLQLEEYLAEDFRSYGIDQSTKKGQPTRNTLFRKILNFIRDLFSSRSTKDRLFKELYFAKSNPKFLKKYSPNIDTTSFKQLNRGIVSLTDPTIDALNRQDAELISNSIDSYISEIIDAAANARGNKSGSISMLLGDKNKQAFYTRVRKDFETKLANARTSYEAIQNDPEKAMDAAKLLNKIRIFQAALDNFGDAKGGLVKYHLENTTFNLLRQKYIEVEEEVETETPVENNVEDSISQTSTPEESQPESVIKDSKIGKKSLLDLASKETVYILKSLHKLENGKPVYNELGYKELANFTQSWNNLMRAVNGEKNPEKIYENIKQAGLEVYPEFKQLLNSKLPKPSEIIKADNVNDKISQNKLLTNFWQDVQKTRVTYLQTTIFENGIAEVTKASIETASLANKFEAKFKGDLTNDYVVRSTENNIPMLNMDKIVEDFGKDGVLITDKSFQFARAIGLYLDDLRMIKNELKKDQRSIQEYGLPYIYKTISDINKASKKQNLSSEGREAITAFRLNPIRELMKGIPESVLGKEVSQKNKIDKILGLQAKYGVDSSNFAVLNAERNLVFEHIEDHSVSMIIYALNKASNMKELWNAGSEFEYLSYLDPKINSFTNRSQTLNSLFDIASDMEKRVGRSLQMFVNSGTQLENGEGTNTTSLDVHGKFLQELHSLLKGGVQEFMRHASKSSSFGARIEGGIPGGVGKGSDTRLWVDLDKFAIGTANNYVTKTHMIPYIAAELERINKFKTNKDLFKKYAGYNRKMPDGTMAGENFTAFDNVLTEDTKNEILEKVTDPNMRLEDYLKTDPVLAKKIATDVDNYFEQQTLDLLDFYSEAEYLSPDLLERLKVFNLSEEEATKVLMKAYAVNAWVHNFEMGSLFYGDLVQYNHEKEELHKRNTGSTSGGLKFRTDKAIQSLLTELNQKVSYAATIPGMDTLAYNGKFNTAILQDIKRDSKYIKPIEEALRKDYAERFAKSKLSEAEIKAEIDRRVAIEIEKYKGMEEGDGQGWITFDAYRALKMASGQWSDVQEELFKKVINNEPINAADVVEMFPVYKVQNYGHLANTDLPVMAMHKFALAPLIPSMIKGSDLENLHNQMMTKNIQYVTFQTGSKVGSVTSEVNKKGEAAADKIYSDDEQMSLMSDIKFTPNTIYLEYLKDVTQVPVSFKGKTVFSTQLRKLILSNLYEKGILDKHADLVKDYENTVDEYGNLLKMELLNDIGYEYKDGKYIGNFTEFLKVIQAELERRDLPEHQIEFINANPDNSLKTDLSLHLKSDDIEKILVALMEKRLVRQKIKGEALVQVSSAMTNGLWNNGLKNATDEDVRKYMGSNNLPFYDQTKDGTSAMKVAIALQGDFVNLLNLKHNDGQPIGTRQRLNQMIKDDKWMSQNEKAVTLTAVRIPVQGLNSMEYMQVWEFLDPSAGNIIIPPSEIVAKSGADFDVDKLTTFMPAISKDGKFIESAMDNEAIKRLIESNKDTPEGKATISRVISQQKAALENKLITSINNILKLPENYAALVRPNDTYLLKDDVADKLEDKVADYNRFRNYHGEAERPGTKAKRSISPTRTLEPLYNLHKHEANMIGKNVLGLVAIYNALHPIYNSLGAKMPKKYFDTYFDSSLGKYVEGTTPIETRLLTPHNTTKDNEISLSDVYTADGVDLISDLYSQMINGAVDVEKDAWIFFIQGNMELAPMILTLFKAGVPRDYAVKFLSQPMIREYAKELRLLGGSYADLVAGELEDAKAGKNKRAAISVLEKFGIQNAPAYVKSDIKTHRALSALIKKSGILNEEGQFDIKLLEKMLVADIQKDSLKDHQLAVFLHFLELQNQFSGFQDLLRLSNPDTTTSKTTQEMVLRKVLLSQMEKNSKVDPELVKKLRNESILGTFYDNDIIRQLIEPLFPLKNNPTVTKAIINLMVNRASDIKKSFGYGDDGKRMFITQYKNGLVNYLFQNAMYNYTQSDTDVLNIPSELIDRYFTGDVFFQNLDYSFADDMLTLIEENPNLKEKYSILNQLAKPELKEGQQILTLNDNKLLKSGQLAESYYENLKELADPNVEKVSNTEKNLYISNMFKLLPLMTIYQNGVGFSKYGFNEALPFDDFLAIMNPVSAEFISKENKVPDLTNVFNGIKDPKNRFFRNYVNIVPGRATVAPTQPATTLPGPETKINIYAGTGENAELSNFAERPFNIKVDNLMQGELITSDPREKYISVEQAFQVMKYQYLNWHTDAPRNSEEQQEAIDNVIAEIDKETNPSIIKKLGRKVQLSNEQVAAWDKVASKFMKAFIKESFKQNPDALAKLLVTGNATLTHTQDKGKWGTEFPRLLMEVRNELRGTQPSTQPKVTGTQITYTPKGKETQTYTVRGAQIFNSAGVEVFKGDSVDRNKVFANLAVAEGRAVVVEHNGSKYVVNKRNQIISGTTGKMMQWAENNGDRLAIVKKAQDKFEANTLNLESDTVKDTEITETPTPNTGNITPRLLVLNSTEFQSWYKGELTKNPNLDVNKALDYYIKCKGL
jgi:predicted NAD-dependent protein-ADP-ribosyltransferase YbiA (DUF1768 family)